MKKRKEEERREKREVRYGPVKRKWSQEAERRKRGSPTEPKHSG